ncbi:MAG: hypothetical protein WDM88_03275 [Galbitalea sp.]
MLTFDGQLLSYTTSDLSDALVSGHRTRGAIASYALFSAKGIGASAETKKAWNGFDHTSTISLKFQPPPPSRLGFDIAANAILDMHVYYNRIYVATDQGTWSAALESSSELRDFLSDQRRHVSHPTESLSVGMGAVAASLGTNGISVFLGVWDQSEHRETRIERESRRSTLGWGQATNYPTDSSYELLEIDKTVHRGRQVLSDVRWGDATTVEMPDNTYAIWDARRLLVADEAGVSSLGRADTNSRNRRISGKGGTHRPLWIGPTGNRLMITETDGSLNVGRGDRVLTLYKGPLGSVRTFPGSHRYRRLVAATVEGGFILSAVFRDGEDFD